MMGSSVDTQEAVGGWNLCEYVIAFEINETVVKHHLLKGWRILDSRVRVIH